MYLKTSVIHQTADVWCIILDVMLVRQGPIRSLQSQNSVTVVFTQTKAWIVVVVVEAQKSFRLDTFRIVMQSDWLPLVIFTLTTNRIRIQSTPCTNKWPLRCLNVANVGTELIKRAAQAGSSISLCLLELHQWNHWTFFTFAAFCSACPWHRRYYSHLLISRIQLLFWVVGEHLGG